MDQTMPSLAPLCVHKDFCNYSLNVLISLAFWNVFFQQLLPSEVGFSLFSSLFYWSMSFYFIDKEKDKSNWAREISRIFFFLLFWSLNSKHLCVYMHINIYAYCFFCIFYSRCVIQCQLFIFSSSMYPWMLYKLVQLLQRAVQLVKLFLIFQ